MRGAFEAKDEHAYPVARDAVRDLLWMRHKCYLLALDEPDARAACAVLEVLLGANDNHTHG